MGGKKEEDSRVWQSKPVHPLSHPLLHMPSMLSHFSVRSLQWHILAQLCPNSPAGQAGENKVVVLVVIVVAVVVVVTVAFPSWTFWLCSCCTLTNAFHWPFMVPECSGWYQCIGTQPKPWCSGWYQCVVTQPKPWCFGWCPCVVTQPKPWCFGWC